MRTGTTMDSSSDDNLAVFDREAALERVDGDEELFQEIAELFLEDFAEDVTSVKQAVAAGDATAIDHAAHKIKGSVGNLGGVAAQQVAFELEQIGRSGDAGQAPEVLPRLLAELDKLKTLLEKVAKEGLPTPG